jgi:hypothetical protein
MVKRRKLDTPKSRIEINRFISEADDNKDKELSPKARRNYKSIAIPFNQYEFQKLEFACEKTGRSKNSLIRFLIIQCANKIEEKEELL